MQHATAHWRESGHPVIASFEPGEAWFWDYQREEGFEGPELADPQSHPSDQPTPGPEGAVPDDMAWFPQGIPVLLAELEPSGPAGKDSGVDIKQDRTLLRVVGFGGDAP